MFDFIHKNRRIVQIILALLTVPFAIWGIESYTRIGGSRDVVASVNGLDITVREYQERYRVQQDQVRRMFGNTVDPAQLDTPEARRALLESMVVQRLVAAEVARGHLLMSREAVIDLIATAPEFQENGTFSPAKYSAFLAQANTTDARAEPNARDGRGGAYLGEKPAGAGQVGAGREGAPGPLAGAAEKAARESGRGASGGDLGSVTRDSLVSAKLADAVMAMKQGEV